MVRQSLDGVFTVRAALASGVPPGRLRVGRGYSVPFRGVRSVSPLTELADRCRALASVLDDDVAFSHVTALRLLGVDVPWTLENDHRLHVVSLDPAARAERPGVVAHRTRQERLELVEIDGLRVTAPAQTFVQVAVGLRQPESVVVLGDAMTRRRSMLTTVDELADTAARTFKVKGVAQVREQIGRVRPGTDSVMETRTRLLLTDAGLPCPEVNPVVHLPDGTYVKRCDMYYRRQRVVIEFDGDQHRTDRAQWQDDIRRRRWLEEIGHTVVIAVGDDVVRDDSRLIARVRSALR